MISPGSKPTYRVYDPISKKWSIGWVMEYDVNDRPIRWIPVWPD